jgi:hypothetical protein
MGEISSYGAKELRFHELALREAASRVGNGEPLDRKEKRDLKAKARKLGISPKELEEGFGRLMGMVEKQFTNPKEGEHA